MKFLRIMWLLLTVGCFALIFTHGFWLALSTWLLGSVLIWVALTLMDAFQAVRGAFRRPLVHIHIEDAPHPDPTRPTEDEHPLIVLGETEYRRNNGA